MGRPLREKCWGIKFSMGPARKPYITHRHLFSHREFAEIEIATEWVTFGRVVEVVPVEIRELPQPKAARRAKPARKGKKAK